jgi:hypothetical protein
MATITTEPATTESPQPAAPVPSYRPHEITLDEYYRMIEAGVFARRPKIFLLEGRLYEKMPPNRPHLIAADALVSLLKGLLPEGWHAISEQPVETDEKGMPQPDVSVIRGRSRDYPKRHPAARDVGMLAEVSDSSLSEDKGGSFEFMPAAAFRFTGSSTSLAGGSTSTPGQAARPRRPRMKCVRVMVPTPPLPSSSKAAKSAAFSSARRSPRPTTRGIEIDANETPVYNLLQGRRDFTPRD